MASILRVNTLTDASSNNSTAMSTINQGTAKAWVNFTGITTTAPRDSFNISSLVDAATAATYPISFTSNMANADYAGSYFQNGATNATYNGFNNGWAGGFGTKLTASFGVYSHNNSGGIDTGQNDVIVQGDLA
jgi:hypothetical protein